MADLAFLNNQEPAPVNLFEGLEQDVEDSVFSELDPMAGYDFAPTEPNPVTTEVGAMALADENVSNRVEAMSSLERARDTMRASLEQGQEQMVRSQIALDRVTRKSTELELNVPKYTDTP